MKTLTKKLIATLLISILIFPIIPIGHVFAVLTIPEPITALDLNQRLTINYSISPGAVGAAQTYVDPYTLVSATEAVQRITLTIKVENIDVSGFEFRLGWKDNIVTPTRNNAANTPTRIPSQCTNIPTTAIDTEGNRVGWYFDADAAYIPDVEDFIYIGQSINTGIQGEVNKTSYPLLSNNYMNMNTDGGITFIEITFQIRPGKTEGDIDGDTFFLTNEAGNPAVPTGVQVFWFEENGENHDFDYHVVSDAKVVKFNNIPNAFSIKDMEWDPEPTKDTYKNEEEIDLTGGTIKVTFSDDSEIWVPVMIQDPVGEPGDMILNPYLTILSGSLADYGTTGEHTLVLKYTDPDYGCDNTIEFDVTVEDEIIGIEVVTEPKTDYYYEDSALDLTGGTIKIIRLSGEDAPIDMTATGVSVSTLDASTLGTKTITVTYTYTEDLVQKTKTDTFDVYVDDYVDYITLADMPTTVVYGTSMNLSGATLTEHWACDGADTPRAVLIGYISDFSNTTLGYQTATVTYNGKSATFGITVTNPLTGITLVGTKPTEVEYGEGLNLSGVTVTASYTTGPDTTGIVITEDMISGFDNETVGGPQTITITYEGFTATFDITITNPIVGIEVKNPKKQYVKGSSFDTGTGYIELTYKDETTGTVGLDATGVDIAGFNSSAEVTGQTITVTYEGFTDTYTINVTDAVLSIALDGTPIDEYLYGDTLDLTGLELTITRESGTSNITLTSDMIVDFDTITEDVGTIEVVIEYGGQTTSYFITVDDYVEYIVLNDMPTTVEYGESIDFTGATITPYWAYEGAGTPVSASLGVVSDFSNTTLDLQTATMTYAGKSETFDITVINPLQSIALVGSIPATVNYGIDTAGLMDILDTAGVTITATYKDAPVTGIAITEGTLSGYSGTTLGTQTVTVTYEGKTTTFSIEVVDYVTDIALIAPTKLAYDYNEDLVLTGGTVQKIMASGTYVAPVALTDGAVTVYGYSKTTLGAQTVSVDYAGFTKTFGVLVSDRVTGITITPPTKLSYLYDDPLDVTGGTVTITRLTGPEVAIPMTSSMTSGYDARDIGTQTITVTYQDQTATFNITLSDYVNDMILTPPTKSVYGIDDPIDLTGGKINLKNASGSVGADIALTAVGVNVAGFDSSTEGVKTITVSYTGHESYSKTFAVTVVDPVASILIVTTPTKTSYLYGEPIDTTGGTLFVTKESGATETINITSDMIVGYSATTLGAQTLTIEYEEKTCAGYGVTVSDYQTGIVIKPPTKTVYEWGQDLDLAGGTVAEKMASGAEENEIPLEGSMISGYNKNQEGTQTITVTNYGYTKTFNVTVVDSVAGISMKTPPNKINYNVGENLDVTGATINVVRTSGIKEVIVIPAMVDVNTLTEAGSKSVTVTYAGFNTNFVVNVTGGNPGGGGGTNTNTNTNRNTSTNTSTNTNINTNTTSDNTVGEPLPYTGSEDEPKEKEEQKENKDPKVPIASTETDGTSGPRIRPEIIGFGLLFLLLILLVARLLRKNVEIYNKQGNEYVLIGKEKITKSNASIMLDSYRDSASSDDFEVILKKSISKKLDNRNVRITLDGNTNSYKVNYNDSDYEIIVTK